MRPILLLTAIALASCGPAASTSPDVCRPSADAGHAAADAGASAPDAGEPCSDAGTATLGHVSATQLHDELQAKDFLLIDVHIPYAGEIPGTDAHIAYTDVDGLVAFIGSNLDAKVVLTCLGGSMSVEAGNALVARGYRQIRSLDGGMNGWVAAGYTLTHELP